MEINNRANVSFQAKFLSSPALVEVKKYAETNGLKPVLDDSFKKIGELPKRIFQIKHRYLKAQDLVKTEFTWTGEDAKKKVYVAIADKIKNPAEATYNMIVNISNKTGKVYRDLFEK